MKTDEVFFRILKWLARIFGVFWILGGVYFIFGAFVDQEDRLLHFLIGVFLLSAGTGLITVRPAVSDDVAKIRSFVQRIEERTKK
jgi:uncharacterized membrane protein HdeD (DUF308 family)